MIIDTDKTSITSWAEEDRPREKLINWGKSTMSNAELLGIIIGSGNREDTAIDLAKKILARHNNDLGRVAKLKSKDLMKFKGIGLAKAINIIATFELGKRMSRTEIQIPKQIKSSETGYQYLRPVLEDLDHEEFWVILLSKSNRIISKERISIGGVSATIVDSKIVFSKALDKLASGIILAHNHPSGNLSPSSQDVELTRKLCAAAKLLDMRILDHIILTNNTYYSFADDGILPN